ncbi:MAG: hypothetical protein IKL28_00240 [Lachnospiraceae bacterium]|nr:hypothetical protein [Lachnospiraceae bacterium]
MEKENTKLPASPERILKTMMIMTFSVAAVFFLKNLLGKNIKGAVVIGVCLALFAGVIFTLTKMKMPATTKQLVISVGLMLVVFMISTNSGEFLSDDFILMLAVIGLGGLYLEPLYPIVQGVVGLVLLTLLRILYPHKADPDGQYIMCLVVFAVASFVMYMMVKRGKAYIELGNERAEQAEHLLASIQQVGAELEANCEQSSVRVAGISEINENLKGNVEELKKGSESVTEGTREVGQACIEAMTQVMITGEHITSLNDALKKMEDAMAENKVNIHAMSDQMQNVRREIAEENEVFAILQDQINEIAMVTDQITSIAASTKMLALNASIEAARAGASGAGFAVVAAKVQDLAVDSNRCSEQVVAIVERMKEQIARTASELNDSVEAMEESAKTMEGLEEGCAGLTTQFGALYDNVEEQNKNIQGIDSIFGNLRDRILEMGAYAEENQAMVDTIATATVSYREYVSDIVDDTRHIHDLSVAMLETSAAQR